MKKKVKAPVNLARESLLSIIIVILEKTWSINERLMLITRAWIKTKPLG